MQVISEDRGDTLELLNLRVRFWLADVYFPEPATLLDELRGTVILQGRVVGLSDAGTEKDVFALIAVERVSQVVVVPVKKIIGTD